MQEIRQAFESDRISSSQVLNELLCGHLHDQHTLAKAGLAEFQA